MPSGPSEHIRSRRSLICGALFCLSTVVSVMADNLKPPFVFLYFVQRSSTLLRVTADGVVYIESRTLISIFLLTKSVLYYIF